MLFTLLQYNKYCASKGWGRKRIVRNTTICYFKWGFSNTGRNL